MQDSDGRQNSKKHLRYRHLSHHSVGEYLRDPADAINKKGRGPGCPRVAAGLGLVAKANGQAGVELSMLLKYSYSLA
jgi:hypothetical protein